MRSRVRAITVVAGLRVLGLTAIARQNQAESDIASLITQ